jgi:hypothetical protein
MTLTPDKKLKPEGFDLLYDNSTEVKISGIDPEGTIEEANLNVKQGRGMFTDESVEVGIPREELVYSVVRNHVYGVYPMAHGETSKIEQPNRSNKGILENPTNVAQQATSITDVFGNPEKVSTESRFGGYAGNSTGKRSRVKHANSAEVSDVSKIVMDQFFNGSFNPVSFAHIKQK